MDENEKIALAAMVTASYNCDSISILQFKVKT